MRAMTVQQPFAWALIHGGKNPENRRTNIAGDYRGRLLIHAGREWSHAGARSGQVWDALRDIYGWPTGPLSAREDARPGFDVIRPIGAVIGVVDLVDVHLASTSCGCGSWAESGVWHLVCARPRPLRDPVPARGFLGLWRPEQDVVDAVRRQLRERTLYNPSNLGKPCVARCGLRVPQTLNDAGIHAHPCCGPSELNLIPRRTP